MNRRGFLGFAATAAGLLVVPELLLPRKTFFLPPAGGWREGNDGAHSVVFFHRDGTWHLSEHSLEFWQHWPMSFTGAD